MSGIALAKVVGALVVAAGAGIGGYNYATTGCMLRSSCSLGAQAAVTPVSDQGPAGACPLGCEAKDEAGEAEAAGSCCSLSAEAAVTPVSDAAHDKAGCCEGSVKECCQGGEKCCEGGEGCCAGQG